MRSYWKRTTAALLGAAVLCGTTLPAFAAENDTTPGAEQQDTLLAPYSIGAEATVTEVPDTFAADLEAGSARLLVNAMENGVEMEVALNIGSDTIFLDNTTGTPVAGTQVKKGDKIYVYHSPAMTRSLPPQTYTQAILVNLGDKTPAKLHVVEQVQAGKEGAVTVLTDRGSMLVTVGKDTPIAPLYTKNIVTTADIQEGTRLFAWYDVVALSYPGQATAERVVLLPAEQEQSGEAADENEAIAITVNGKALEATAKKNGDVVMVPLRAVGEAMGYIVTWDQAEHSANLNNGKGQTTVTLGKDQYVYTNAQEGMVGMSAPTSLGAAPVMEEPGTLWVPAQLFSLLTQQEAVTLNGSTLEIAVK